MGIEEAISIISDRWGEDGDAVIWECMRAYKQPQPFSEFLNNCTACGGNWVAMMLSGISRIAPRVYDAIPQNMGLNVIVTLTAVLALLGIDTSC